MGFSLLSACDHPFVSIPDSKCLKPGNIAACECFADCQANELLSVKYLGDNFCLELRRPEVQNRRKSDDFARQESIDIGTGAET